MAGLESLKVSPAITINCSLRPHDTAAQHNSTAAMADQAPPAQAPAAEGAATHTDPVTGEKISKSELKRRTKQREKDEKKKEKEAALPARPKKEGKKEDVEELNPNV